MRIVACQRKRTSKRAGEQFLPGPESQWRSNYGEFVVVMHLSPLRRTVNSKLRASATMVYDCFD